MKKNQTKDTAKKPSQERKNNPLRRLKELDGILSTGRSYTYDELLDELDTRGFKTSRRSLLLDLDYIEREREGLLFRRPNEEKYTLISYDLSSGCDSIFAPVLSEEEATLLEGLLKDYHFEELKPYNNLRRLITQAQKTIKSQSQNKKVHFEETYNSSPLKHFPKLFEFISQKRTIRLKYRAINSLDTEREVELYPYQLREYNRRWYLVAAPVKNLEPHRPAPILTFALDRIEGVTELFSEKYQEFPKAWDLHDKFFADIIGVTRKEDSPVLDILCWAENKSYHYIETKPLHEEQRAVRGSRAEELQRQYPALEGGVFFTLKCRDNYELRRELLSYGKGLLVLEPLELRTELQKQLSEHLKNYTDKGL